MTYFPTTRVRPLTILLVAGALTVAPAPARAQSVVATSNSKAVAAGSPEATLQWTYVFALTNMCQPCGDDTFVRVTLAFPVPVSMRVVSDPLLWVVTTSSNGAITVTRRGRIADTVMLTLTADAPAAGLTSGTIDWQTDGTAEKAAFTGTVQGPKRAAESDARFTALVGGGFSLLQDDFAEYELIKDADDKDILVTKNDSRLRASALTGVGFAWTQRLGLFAGIEYAAGTTALLDSFTFGFTYRLTPDLSLVAGYARSKGFELTPSARRTAAAYVKANSDKFPGVGLVPDGSELQDERHYDGIPMDGFRGRVTTESWNGSFIVGLVFPVSLKIGGDKKD